MWRFIKWLVKFLVFLLIVLCIVWFGLKYYFTHIHRIGDTVRQQVLAQVQNQHSQYIPYNQIPAMYRKAVIATEDRSFFTNVGLNFRGMSRAIFADLGSSGTLQGASTITQQLVHNTLLNNTSKSPQWKLKESVYAIGVYDTVSKPETFALYANAIYFGHGAYGLYEASETYFGRQPSDLNEGEMTLLAGLPNAPSVYDPFQNMRLARQRQQLVLKSMVADGVITPSEAVTIANDPIRLR